MGSAKAWWSLPPIAVAESQRMVKAAASPRGGETVKAQILSAQRNLGLDYWTIWNAWQGKIGSRAFPKLLAAYHRWIDEQSGKEIEALRARLERLERHGDLDASLDSQSAARSRTDLARVKG